MGEFSNPEGYELWMGRWSTRLAPKFLDFSETPAGGRLLDVGSGTGVLAKLLLERDAQATIVGIEPAESYVAYSRARVTDPRVRFQRGDAMDLPFENDTFDATLALLILQELSDPPRAVSEMRRVTKPGGLVAASQWDFHRGLPMLGLFWEAAMETLATDEARQAAARGLAADYPDGDALTRLWEREGLADVSANIQEIEMTFSSFDDYWAPFMSGATFTSSYVRNLGEENVTALKDRLRKKIAARAGDGAFTLPARAWSVRGLKKNSD